MSFFFHVPAGSNVDSPDGSIVFKRDQSSNRSGSSSEHSRSGTSKQFRIPGSTSLFVVPHDDLDSSAVFTHDKSSGSDK